MVFTLTGFIVRVILTVFLVGLTVFLLKKNARVGFWLALFIIGLLPTIAMASVGVAWIIAERYAYFAAIGIYVLIGLSVKKLGEIVKKKEAAYIIIAVLVFLLAARTISRNVDWKNQDNLWLAAAKTSPSSAQNHNNLGDMYARHGDLEKAVEEFQIATKLLSNYGDAYHNLANIYMKMGKNDLALKNYQKALSINPNLWESRLNLAAIYFDQGNIDGARQELEKAIETNPNNGTLFSNLGIVYLQQGQPAKAREMFQKALQVDPQNQTAKNYLMQLK